MLVLACVGGFLAALAASTATLSRRRTDRALRIVTVFAVVGLLCRIIVVSGLRLNGTPSMPVGLYRLAPIRQTGLRRGMLVAVCAPLKAAQLGRHRAYLSGGRCAGDAEPLLKTVVGVVGDVVSTAENGILVNGHLLPDSRPLSFDSAGRTLVPWSRKRYRLRPHQVWVYADHPKSWDSRYWGPVRSVTRVVPLFTSFP